MPVGEEPRRPQATASKAEAPKQSMPLNADGTTLYGSASAAAADPSKFFRDTVRWFETSDDTDPSKCLTWFCEDFRPRKMKAPFALAWLVLQAAGLVFQLTLYGEVSRHLDGYEDVLATYCGPEHWRGDVCLGPMWDLSFTNTFSFAPVPDASGHSDFDFVIASDSTFAFQTLSQPPTFLVGFEPLQPHMNARWEASFVAQSGWKTSDKSSIGSSWKPLRASGKKYAVVSFKDFKGVGVDYVCAQENSVCDCPSGRVRYGHDGTRTSEQPRWTDWRPVEESVMCSNEVFGDDFPHQHKECMCRAGEFQCALEGALCSCTGEVKYGHAGRPGEEASWSAWRPSSGSTECSNKVFGDVAPHSGKVCRCRGRQGPSSWTGSVSLKSSFPDETHIHVFVVDSRIQHLEDIHEQKQCKFDASWANFNMHHSGQHHQILLYTQSATFFFLMVSIATTSVVFHRFYFYVEAGKLLSRIIAVKFVIQDFPQQMCIAFYLYGWYAQDGLRCQMCLFHPEHCDDEYPLHWNNLMVCVFTLLSACSNQLLLQAKNKKYDEEDECMLFLARGAIFSVSVLPFSTAFFFLSFTLLNIRSVWALIVAGIPTLIGWWACLAMPMFALCDEDM